MKIKNFCHGEWIEGRGEGRKIFSAIDGTHLFNATTEGIDWASVLAYGREVGGSSLRKMTFHQRGRMLKALALHLLSKKEKFYQLSYQTGATKRDSWIDIEGGAGNLFTMSSKGRRELPDTPFYRDEKVEKLSVQGSFMGQHIYFPREGVALHINAFNFPVWGMLEKIAVNLLAGVPAVVKPATATCYLAQGVVEEIVNSKILPQGALQLLCGGVGDILESLEEQDIVTFTGSASTGQKLKSHPNIIAKSIPFNLEADSLNCSILGTDVSGESEEFNIFIREVVREMTVKAGQKCTAIRRIMVPANLVEEVETALVAKIKKVVLGDPRKKETTMGPLASREQVQDVEEQAQKLIAKGEVIYRAEEHQGPSGGAFLGPILIHRDSVSSPEDVVNSVEAFGPVATVVPYRSGEEAVQLAKWGRGSLVGSVVSLDDEFIREVVWGCASHHGRFVILNRHCIKESTGHGSPLPVLNHGGPGRAGGGQEMGGVAGIFTYMQKTAIQGHPTTLTSVSKNYAQGGDGIKPPLHPFRLAFGELKVGHSIETEERVITPEDIDAFSQLSGDHFWAHKREGDFANSLFESQVAHGYFIMSVAAGLFVDAPKGPILANYGIDEFRFTSPVYPGTKIRVRLTVKEKINQDDREGEIPRGIVKWMVEVIDDQEEIVALGTILTLVAKENKLD